MSGDSRAGELIEALLSELGLPRRVELPATADRARSFGCVDRWRISGGEGASAQLHTWFLQQAGTAISRAHSFHPSNLTGVVCDYARLVQAVFPFEIVIAAGRGTAKDGTGCGFGARSIGIVDGRCGLLGSPTNTSSTEHGTSVSTWSAVQLSPGGASASRRAPPIDLTEVVAAAARRALAASQAGDTRLLREWLVLMTALDSSGLAAEELFASEAPKGADFAQAFEAFDSGAIMPVWSQRAFGSFAVEARLRLPDRGGFTFKLLTRDREAPQRHRLEPPLGPA